MTTGNTFPNSRLNISPADCRDFERSVEYLARLVKSMPADSTPEERRNAKDSAKETALNLRKGDCRGKLGETEGGLMFICDRAADCGANTEVDADVHPHS